MSHTPIQTPTTKKSNKKLPMIVDIALDDNGKQLYQVHESSRFVRKEMPKSTKFNNNVSGTLIDDEYEEKTPIRKILGTISPSTLNQKKLNDDESTEDSNLTEPESSTRNNSIGLNLNAQSELSFYNDNSLHLSAFDYDHEDDDHREEFMPEGHDHDQDQELDSDLSANKVNDIWSEDVEQAFEEVLSIIPKNGLNKIKISGRSCGRNELISDYILTKTGKFRTRKQVSSHIQVIKNLGQKSDIIKLINEGPSFDNEQDQDLNTKTFEEIFSKITLNKSLGFNKSNKRQFIDLNSSSTRKEKKSKSESKSRPNPLNLSIGQPQINLDLCFEDFYISIGDGMLNGSQMLLTIHDNQEIKNLKLKPNANISNRFPDLTNLASLNLPIVHNLVKLNIPTTIPLHYSIDEGLKSNLFLKASNANPFHLSKSYSIFTIIYNYGKEFFKINENHVKLNENYTFLNRFWKFFVNNEINSNSSNLNHLTMKQILYESPNDSTQSDEKDNKQEGTANYLKIPKQKIRGVFLWEFIKVDDPKDALTTTSKLILSDDLQATMPFHPLPPQSLPSGSLEQPLLVNVPVPVPVPVSSFQPNANSQQIVPQIINYNSGVSSGFYDPNVGSSTGTADMMSSNYAYSSIQPIDSNFIPEIKSKKFHDLDLPASATAVPPTAPVTHTAGQQSPLDSASVLSTTGRPAPSTANTAIVSAAGDIIKVETDDLNQLNAMDTHLNLPMNYMSASSPIAQQQQQQQSMAGVPMHLMAQPSQMTANYSQPHQMMPHQNIDYDYFYYSDANYQGQ